MCSLYTYKHLFFVHIKTLILYKCIYNVHKNIYSCVIFTFVQLYKNILIWDNGFIIFCPYYFHSLNRKSSIRGIWQDDLCSWSTTSLRLCKEEIRFCVILYHRSIDSLADSINTLLIHCFNISFIFCNFSGSFKGYFEPGREQKK